ncbi:hypothetical protein DFP72DRAFT_846313 [Ephemerocybe angulata]|uniref:Glucose-methanol-choline oxidoreductase C-terminal domain-containing protein n=1 Tax=Ephemerocybe angulata TaxID=980116 RepID=A0A8H6I1G8_9AGAR|nr:hypothetical protein DFP72DRAFT_846313 [Tulosesus angulatus]
MPPRTAGTTKRHLKLGWTIVQLYIRAGMALIETGVSQSPPYLYIRRDILGQFDPRYHGSEGKLRTSLAWGGPSTLDRLSLFAAQELKRDGYWFNIELNDGDALGLTWAQWTIGNGERSSAATAYLSKEVRSRKNLESDSRDLAQIGVQPIHDLPNVGKGLWEHVSVLLSWTRSVNETAYVTPSLSMSSVSPAEALARWQADRMGPYAEAVSAHQILWKRFDSVEGKALLKHYGDPSIGPTSPMSKSIVLLTHQSRGSIKLRSSNPLDPPLVDLGFYTHPFDILAMREAIRAVHYWIPKPDPDALAADEFEARLRALSNPYWHVVGTASFAKDGGVVDSQLRPYVPTAHTQAAVYGIAERAAALVKDAWRLR